MPLDDQDTIKNNVDKLMRERGWTISETAKRAGLKNSSLYNVRGGADIGAEMLIKLAKAFGVTVEELMGDAPPDGDQLTQEEQDAIAYLRRLPQSKRRAAVRILRDVIDGMLDAPG